MSYTHQIFIALIAFLPSACGAPEKSLDGAPVDRSSYVDDYDSRQAWGKVNDADVEFVSGRATFIGPERDNRVRIELSTQVSADPCSLDESVAAGAKFLQFDTTASAGESIIGSNDKDSWMILIDPASLDAPRLYVKKGRFALDEVSDSFISGRVNGFKDKSSFITGRFKVTRCQKTMEDRRAERRNYVDKYDDAPAWGRINGQDVEFVVGCAMSNGTEGGSRVVLLSEAVADPCGEDERASVKSLTFDVTNSVGETVIDANEVSSWMYLFDPEASPQMLYVKTGRVAVDDVSETTLSGRLNGYKTRDNFVTGTFSLLRSH